MPNHSRAARHGLTPAKFIEIALPTTLACVMSFAPAAAAADDSTMPASASVETSYVAPVWRLDVTQHGSNLTPRLVSNAFADSIRPHRFPLHDLPLVRVTSGPPQKMSSDSYVTEVAVDIARLPVGQDGRIPATPPSFFLMNTHAWLDPWTGHTTFLCVVGPGGRPNGSDPAQDFYVDLGAIPGEVYQWQASPDGSWGIVHTTAEIAILRRNFPPIHTHLGPIILGAFSRDGSKYVAIKGAPMQAGIPRDQWFVIGRDGEILHEGPAAPATFDHLEFAPDGKSILVSWRRGDSNRVCLDSGKEEPLPAGWWSDDHYYSADGRTALSVNRTSERGSLLRLFDCSDPTSPIPLGEPLGLAASIQTAAVSPDGTLIALQESEGDSSSGDRTRLTVYDRGLHRRALLLGHTLRRGLQFAGRQLLVGNWTTTSRFGLQSTTGILVYDLSEL